MYEKDFVNMVLPKALAKDFMMHPIEIMLIAYYCLDDYVAAIVSLEHECSHLATEMQPVDSLELHPNSELISW